MIEISVDFVVTAKDLFSIKIQLQSQKFELLLQIKVQLLLFFFCVNSLVLTGMNSSNSVKF
jgi:hypothetical protein